MPDKEYDRKAYDFSELSNVNKPRTDVVLVLDNSASMSPHIDTLNEAYEYFLKVARSSEKALSYVDLSIVRFGSEASIAQEWTSIQNAEPKKFDADLGCTDYNAAVDLAIKQLEKKRAEERSIGTPFGAQTIFFLTDGEPTSDASESQQKIRDLISERDSAGLVKYRFIPIYIGDDGASCNGAMAELKKFGSHVIMASPSAYAEVFDFIRYSITAIKSSFDQKTEAQVSVPAGLTVISL